MNSVRVVGYLILSIFTLATFSNCATFPDCKAIVVSDAKLRNDLLKRSVNFYQNYDLKLEFEDYFIKMYSHMCDEKYSVCYIKLHFQNSSKPYLTGRFEEKYKIDEFGKHVTINGTWNPYSSIYPYNFEKVDDGFDFYKDSNTTTWFHTSNANLSDEFNMTTSLTTEEINHFLRLQKLRKSAFELLNSLEGEDKFVEYKYRSFGLDSHVIRFQKYPEIELYFTKTIEKMSFDMKYSTEPLKFDCLNGDYNTYNIAVNAGRYVRGGWFRNTSSPTFLKMIISGKNVSSSLIEEDYGRAYESDCNAMVVNDADLRDNLFQRTLNFYRQYDLKIDFEDCFIYLFRHMCHTRNPTYCSITLLFKNSSNADWTGKYQEKYRVGTFGEILTSDGVWNPYSSNFAYNFKKIDGGFDFYKNSSDIWFHAPIDNLSDDLSDEFNLTTEETQHLLGLKKLRTSVSNFLSGIKRPDKYFEYKNSTIGSDFDSLRFQDYPEIDIFFTKTIEKMSVNPDNPTVTFKCTNGYVNAYKIELTVSNRLFFGYFRITSSKVL